VKRATKSPDFWERGAAYGIKGEAVDGMDVLAVKAAGEKAVAHCRAGKGPYILEVMTYRYRGHSMSDPAKYRTREEVQEMREKRDAIEHVRQLLLTGKHATEDDLKKIDKEIKDIVNEAAEFSKESPEPALDELWTDIYARSTRLVVERLRGIPFLREADRHGNRNSHARALPHDGGRHARQMAGEGGRHRLRRRHPRRDRDRQGHDGIRSRGRRRHGQDPDRRGHRGREGQHPIAILVEEGEDVPDR
jgi:hypothetical protein